MQERADIDANSPVKFAYEILSPSPDVNDDAEKDEDYCFQPSSPSSVLDDSKEGSSVETTDESSDPADLSGQVTLPNGIVIDRNSAAFLPKSKKDPDDEDQFGYTPMKIQRRYAKLAHQPDGSRGILLVVTLNRGSFGLGISLAGNKDRSRVSTYICGMNPTGNAFRDGNLMVGDMILEINGKVVHDRHHLNVASLIKSLSESTITIVVLRTEEGLQSLAVRPLSQFPQDNFKENPINRYLDKYTDVREVLVFKDSDSLGIKMIEGRHSTSGNGVFISDLKPGSCAEKAGLMHGDMILAVNGEDFVGISYDAAAKVLKKTKGSIKIIVANTLSSCNLIGKQMPETEMNMNRNAEQVVIKADVKVSPNRAANQLQIKEVTDARGVVQNLGKMPIQEDHSSVSVNESKGPIVPKTLLASLTPVKAKNSHLASKGQSAVVPKKPIAGTPVLRRKAVPANPANCEIIPGTDTIIQISKDKDYGVGLAIIGGSDTLFKSIFIHEVYEGGAAFKDGRLKPGDQILEVMNQDVRNVPHSHALKALRQTPNRVRLVVHRPESETFDIIKVDLMKRKDRGLGLSIVGRNSGPGVYISEVIKGGVADLDGRLVQGDQIVSVNGANLSNSSQHEAVLMLKMVQGKVTLEVKRLQASNYHKQLASASPRMRNRNIKTVKLVRDEEKGLGFSIVGGLGGPHGDLPIFVKNVFKGGSAARQGMIKHGDQILAVNGLSLDKMTHNEAVNALKSYSGLVTLHILS